MPVPELFISCWLLLYSIHCPVPGFTTVLGGQCASVAYIEGRLVSPVNLLMLPLTAVQVYNVQGILLVGKFMENVLTSTYIIDFAVGKGLRK